MSVKAPIDTVKLNQRLLKQGMVAIIWSIDDVKAICHTISDEQALEVLKRAYAKHDASNGITWDTLTFWVNELFPDLDTHPYGEPVDDDDDDEPTVFESYEHFLTIVERMLRTFGYTNEQINMYRVPVKVRLKNGSGKIVVSRGYFDIPAATMDKAIQSFAEHVKCGSLKPELAAWDRTLPAYTVVEKTFLLDGKRATQCLGKFSEHRPINT